MRTVNLVATSEQIESYFPGARKPFPAAKPGIMSADFPIRPEKCSTELGRWLARVIATTRFDDDASACKILLPATEQGLRFRELGENLLREKEIRSVEDAECQLARLEAWITEQRKLLGAYGQHACAYRVIQFQWPVFGSERVKDAGSAEAYFDACAGLIRATEGVILHAGISATPLPDGLLRTMARKSGGGDALMARYRAQVTI